MEVQQYLHMNGGAGEHSYAKNSAIQNEIISTAKAIRDEALMKLYRTNHSETFAIADLGCSSGPNSFLVISEVIATIQSNCVMTGCPLKEFLIYLNDLPSNDFNNIFLSVPDFHKKLKQESGTDRESCIIAAVAGSFYGRLFPKRSLHFVHSSSSLHWLSQSPPQLGKSRAPELENKGKIYLSKTSPRGVLRAYADQFRRDFGTFLKARSVEMVDGGFMVLSFLVREGEDPTTPESYYQWELIAHALMDLVSQGYVEKEKVDSLEVPYYTPSPQEVLQVIEEEESFLLERFELFPVRWDAVPSKDNHHDDFISEDEIDGLACRASRVSNTIRAVIESMLETHFGHQILDRLFTRFTELVADHLSKNRAYYINGVMSLKRKA